MAARLRQMQWFATGLLALMVAVFILSSLWREVWPWLNWLRAFAEAAVIGGLADWFAVTALFRHPLGLPIPHTAIVPNRKNEIGRSLSRFVAEHFLVRSVLDAELRRLDLAQNFGRWLQQTGEVPETEMRRTFNCGIGLVLTAPAEQLPGLRDTLTGHGETVYQLGEIVAGSGRVQMQP